MSGSWCQTDIGLDISAPMCLGVLHLGIKKNPPNINGIFIQSLETTKSIKEI